MLRKAITGAVAAAAFYLLPAIGRPEVLNSPKLWILFLAGFLVSIVQPAYKPIDRSAPTHDRGTAAQIVWSVYGTQIFAVLEAIYFRGDEAFRWDAISTAALVMIIAGFALRTWAIVTLGRYFTWFITVYDDHQVIRSGPFRVIRHPAYAGAWVLFVGTPLLLHAWVAVALSAVFQLFAYVRRIRYEEAMMVERLGEPYQRYKREVRALVPLFW